MENAKLISNLVKVIFSDNLLRVVDEAFDGSPSKEHLKQKADFLLSKKSVNDAWIGFIGGLDKFNLKLFADYISKRQ